MLYRIGVKNIFMTKLFHKVKGVYFVTSTLVICLYLLLIIYKNKFFRLFKKFFKRLVEIWYIGFSLILIISIALFIGDRVGGATIVLKFLPGVINTIIAVYLIDFLRIEYERRRDVNRHYLFDLELVSMGFDIELIIEQILELEFDPAEDNHLSEDDIEAIIDWESDFWEELVEKNQSVFEQYDKYISKNDLFLEMLNRTSNNCKFLIQSYASSCPYREYKVLQKLKRVSSGFEQPSYNCSFISSTHWSSLIYDLVECIFEIEEIHNENWYKDNELVGEYRRKQKLLNKYLGFEMLKFLKRK